MNEQRINQLTEILSVVALQGGANERTGIYPNAEVINATPPTLPVGYIIVEDDRGFYVPAVLVSGLTVSDGDKVNLLYIKGTEPIAFQHGTGSPGGSTGTNVNALCGGRLTTQTGVPAGLGNLTLQATLYFTPDYASPGCGQIGLYTGSIWETLSFTEISLSLTGVVSSGVNYDVYVYNNGGTLAIDTLVAWTGNTPNSRTTQDGIYVKSGATTRRLVGTIRGSASGFTEDGYNKRFVWNLYNRQPREMWKKESDNSWTYASSSWRSFNNSTLNRLEMVRGFDIDAVEITAQANLSSNALSNGFVGIGLNSVAANSAVIYNGGGQSNEIFLASASYRGHPGQGYHYLQMLEVTQSANTVTFYGDNNTGVMQSGIVGTIWS